MKPIRQWKCLHPVSIIYLKLSTQLIDKFKVSIFYRDWLHIWRLSSGSLLPNDLNVRFCIISNGAVISVDLTIDLNGLSDSGKEALSSARASAFRDVLIVSRFWDNMLRHNPVVVLYGIDATLLLRPKYSKPLINVRFNSFRGNIAPASVWEEGRRSARSRTSKWRNSCISQRSMPPIMILNYTNITVADCRKANRAWPYWILSEINW